MGPREYLATALWPRRNPQAVLLVLRCRNIDPIHVANSDARYLSRCTRLLRYVVRAPCSVSERRPAVVRCKPRYAELVNPKRYDVGATVQAELSLRPFHRDVRWLHRRRQSAPQRSALHRAAHSAASVSPQPVRSRPFQSCSRYLKIDDRFGDRRALVDPCQTGFLPPLAATPQFRG